VTDIGSTLSAWEQQIADKRRQAEAFQAASSRIQGRAKNATGTVEVAVDHAGVLTDLRIAESAPTGAALAAEIRRCLAAAQSQLAGQMQDVAGASFGAESQTTQRLVGALRDRFAEPEAETPQSWSPPTHRQGR